MAHCRIRVLQRLVLSDIAREHIKTNVGPCPLLREGQEFVVSSRLDKPQGFCDWAWNDLLKFVTALSRGGNFSRDVFEDWMKTDDSMIACCTDGARPVVFEIKRLADCPPCVDVVSAGTDAPTGPTSDVCRTTRGKSG